MSFAGKWECLTKSAYGDNISIWEIEEKDGVYTGTSDAFGAKVPFQSVKFADNKFICELVAPIGGIETKLTMEGQYVPETDMIYGAAESNMGSTSYEGKRIK